MRISIDKDEWPFIESLLFTAEVLTIILAHDTLATKFGDTPIVPLELYNDMSNFFDFERNDF